MLKLALPAGALRLPLASTLSNAGLEISGYREGSRSYRLPGDNGESVIARVFREKDIPVQIGLGNYDLGICSLSWVLELTSRHSQPQISSLGKFDLPSRKLLVAAAEGTYQTLGDAGALTRVRIASEYPNLSERFALAARFPAPRVIAVAGSAGAYPPEDAELAVLSVTDESEISGQRIKPLHELLEDTVHLVANQKSMLSKDTSALMARLVSLVGASAPTTLKLPAPFTVLGETERIQDGRRQQRPLRLALPDGHQHPHVVAALSAAGLDFEGYTNTQIPTQRPSSPLAGLEVKSIRPQDMPQMVARGSFDIAITGRDCINEHLRQFPSSPIEVVLDLGRSPVDICAAVSADLPANTLEEALAVWRGQAQPLIRIASEFPNIADDFARTHHFWRYQVIPTAGASEGFVPEDADILIESSETGTTLAENDLKPIALLFRSTTCVIIRRDDQRPQRNVDVMRRLLSNLKKAVVQPVSDTIGAGN